MKSSVIRKKYIDYFSKRNHVEIPSASLVPENDPTTLFISSGMQPLVPYLLGQKHPSGKRIVNSQKSFRSQDIEEVGDNRHTTFFEMLGNWSLGDYFKEEQLSWIFEFLTEELELNPKNLYVTVFEGDGFVEKDTTSIEIWKKLFSKVNVEAVVGERIFTYPAEKNWWSRSGVPNKMPIGEPGGPDSEVFYDFGEHLKLHEKSEWKNETCHPNCDCGRFMEIANSVFMQYQKQKDGSLKEMSQKNVDFGGGLERIVAAANNDPDVFKTDFFNESIDELQKISNKNYGDTIEITKSFRIIVDHIRASLMMISDGVLPSNKSQGYVLRRLIRRSLLHGRTLGLKVDNSYIQHIIEPIIAVYKEPYPNVIQKISDIKIVIAEEAKRFNKSLDKGLKEIDKIELLDGSVAFRLYETYGFPWEMTVEIADKKGQTVDRSVFEKEFKKHQNRSRTAAAGMFKGGLADQSEETTKLHTATHLLHQALREVLGDHVQQKGSNITAERLRFDFSHPQALTEEEKQNIETLVNKKVQEDLSVSYTTVLTEKARKSGALAHFGERYGEKVKVYSIGSFSKEICGGPHVENTSLLGKFQILKEKSASAGTRRIYATLS
ncbi:alanine--tRNA ligase [Patescibacteria group bacterium]